MGSSCSAYEGDSAAGDEEPVTVSGGAQPDATSGGVAPITEDVTETVVGEGFALSRLAPEQLSNNLMDGTLGTVFSPYRSYDPYAGQEVDYFNVVYGVPLGGIDFQTATTRDPSTKAQTLLVGRVISAQFAAWTFWSEYTNPGSRVVFAKCDLDHDRPFGATNDDALPANQQQQIRAGEVGWNAQLDDLYWRIFSRPPTETERSAVKASFLAVFNQEGYPQAGWIAVFYALLSTEEFWHT